MNISSSSLAYQQPEDFDPWTVPDTFTVWNFAPDYIKPLLHDHWKTQKAVHPLWSYFFGLYYFVIGCISLTGNTMVLNIYGHKKSLRTPANMLIINLAVSDLILVITLIPECVYSFLCGGPWQFGHWGCQIHSFCGGLTGYNQIMTLTIISWDRYNVIVNGLAAKPLSYSKVTGLIALSWIWALGWSIAPLLGWGLFAIDGMLGTCSFDHYTPTWNHKSYVMAAACTHYGCNLLIIIGSYFFIVKTIFKHEDDLRQQAKKMNVTSLRANEEQKAMASEIRAAKIAILNISLWIFAWTPFMVVSLIGTWYDSSLITPLMSELPNVCAKTSALYNPIIYTLAYPKYRQYMKEMYPWMCIVEDNKKMSTRKIADADDSLSAVTVSTR